MNFLERIDALILSFFTKISHKFQIMTGRTNFFLAKITLSLLGLSTVFVILNIFVPLVSPTRTPPLIGLLIGGLWIYWISKDWSKLKDAENKSLCQEQAKTRFLIKGQDYFARLIWLLTFFIFSKQLIIGVFHPKVHWIIELIVHSFLLIVVIYVYFTSVTPLPPGRSKVRQWLESFGKVLVPIPVRNK